MSTKATIAYGRDFHFYHEILDDDHVYLEMENIAFRADSHRVMVTIPVDVWEVIRHTGAARLDLVETSDEELRRIVEQAVSERINNYEEAKGESRRETLTGFFGAGVFGRAETPRTEQLRRGIEHYTKERERQRRVWARIKEHKAVTAGTLTTIQLKETDEEQP